MRRVPHLVPFNHVTARPPEAAEAVSGQGGQRPPALTPDCLTSRNKPRSGRVLGIAPQHPPTPPDVPFSVSGG